MLTTIKKLIEKMKISILASNHVKTALCLIGSSLIISVIIIFFKFLPVLKTITGKNPNWHLPLFFFF